MAGLMLISPRRVAFPLLFFVGILAFIGSKTTFINIIETLPAGPVCVAFIGLILLLKAPITAVLITAIIMGELLFEWRYSVPIFVLTLVILILI